MFNWLKKDREEGEGTGVLLQLTLPVVLILALLIVITTNDLMTKLNKAETRANIAEDNLENHIQDNENTPTGELQREFTATLEQLQLALLKQALSQVQKETHASLSLESHQYKLESIDPVELLDGSVNKKKSF